MADPVADPDPLSARSLRKRNVVETSTAETLGRVADVVLDPAGGRVVGLAVTGFVTGVLPLDGLTAIGVDAVTVEVRDRIDTESERTGPGLSDVRGHRVLGTDGFARGQGEDLWFSPEDGRVTAVETDRGRIAGRLRGVGSWAVVVAADEPARAARR